ncbi:HlyD family efflux transporter periplasmic adaptor subunit [Pontiellaceae bacterium B12227]|nr:HlyD family efflux transporter periplasmic adaptor subunit [Pontiellaceae bacterium B12227]
MKNKEFKRPALRHRRRNLIRQLFNGWPWLIWMAAAITVLVMLPGGMHRVRFYGVAERTYEYISPLESGRLKSLLVNLGDPIHEGQLIGELDNETLASELLMDQASLMKTRDKVQSIRVDIESLKLEEAKTAAELKALEGQWARTEELRSKNLILEQDVEDVRPQIAATKDVLAHYPNLIAQLEQRLKLIEADSDLYSGDELKALQVAQCRLTARTAGVVAEVLHQPGDVVETGDPVVRISNVSTSRIIAFMPEEKRMDIAEGERCRIISSASRAVHHGEVQTVTADIRKLPVFTGFGDQILRGRRIVIELDAGTELVPGEQVVVVPDISILDQWMGKR